MEIVSSFPFSFFSYHQKYLLQRHPWLMNALGIDPEEVRNIQKIIE